MLLKTPTRSLFAILYKGALPACCLLLAAGASAQDSEHVAALGDSPQQHFQSAQTFQIAGDFDKAAAEYREAITRSLQQLGNLRVSHKDYGGGADLLEKALKVLPTALATRVDLGIAKFKAGDFEAAKKDVEAALQQDAHNIRALNLAGKIYFMQGNFQSAADTLQSALQLQPDFDIGYTLAVADLELKKPTPAGVIFDEMLSASKPSASLQALIGIAYRETGYLEQAIIHLNKSIALDGKNPRTYTALGLAYFLRGPDSYAQAQEQFLAGLALAPHDYTDCYYLGMMGARQKKFAESAHWFEEAAAARQSDPDVYMRLGQVQLDAGHFEQAMAALQQSLKLSPREESTPGAALIHELLGKGFEGMGRRSEAEGELARAKQIHDQIHSVPGHAKDAQPSSESYGQQELRSVLLQVPRTSTPLSGDEKQYVKQLSELLGQSYDSWGVIDARSGRYASASDEFAQAAHWNPEIQGLDKKWGLAAFRANKYDEAIPPLDRQTRRTPNDLVLRETLGICYFMTDKFSQASNVFLPVLDKMSSNPGVLYAAGVSLARNGHSRDASKLFSRMLQDNPNVPEVHMLLGEAHSDLAEYPDALGEFARALELDPKLAEAHYYTGIVRFKQGQMDEAAQEFQTELDLHPGSSNAMYQLAVVRLEQQRPDETISLLTGVLTRSPNNSDARYQMGKAMLEKGDLKGAIANLEAAVHVQPKDYSYYQLSLAYRRDGRIQESQQALQMYEHLKQKSPPSDTSAQ
ncbi:MAG: hypothetical protein NVS1B11_35970 [Terriglobales bacterium]